MEDIIGITLLNNILWDEIDDLNRDRVMFITKKIWTFLTMIPFSTGEPHSILLGCYHLVYLYLKNFPDPEPNYIATVIIKIVWSLLDQGQYPNFKPLFERCLGFYYKKSLVIEYEINILTIPINKLYRYIQIDDMQSKELQLSLGRLMMKQIDMVDYDLINRLVSRAKPSIVYTPDEYQKSLKLLGKYIPLC